MAAVGGTIASRASEGAEPVSRLLLSLLTCCVAIAATAAPLSPVARAEIDGLLVRLVASGCEFNRNGVWYTAAEAKSHLSQKLKYFEDRGMVQTTEQFIEMAASSSSMSGASPIWSDAATARRCRAANGCGWNSRSCAR
jgi:hypothetical protein